MSRKRYLFEGKIGIDRVALIVDADNIWVQSIENGRIGLDSSCHSIEELYMKLSYFDEARVKNNDKLERIRAILEE